MRPLLYSGDILDYMVCRVERSAQDVDAMLEATQVGSEESLGEVKSSPELATTATAVPELAAGELLALC